MTRQAPVGNIGRVQLEIELHDIFECVARVLQIRGGGRGKDNRQEHTTHFEKQAACACSVRK